MELKPTTQDVSWFLDQHKRGLLDLDPPYQRNSVWTAKDRKYFLDTVFNGYPSPAIYLHKEIGEEGKTTWHVVDGKQRLSTIINFTNNKIALDKEIGDERLAGKRWKGLETETELKMRFWNYTFQVQVLPEIELDWIRDVFDRLNRNSKNLERQELRHAKYDGWFINFLERQTDNSEWQLLKVVTTGRAKRMKDVQFLAELARVAIKKEIVGFDQDDLDKLHADYDNSSDDNEEFDLDFIENSQKPPFFNEEEFGAEFEEYRKYFVEVENNTKAISKYANTYNNFYSIWALLVLSEKVMQDISAKEFGEKYISFMEEVKSVSELKDIASIENIEDENQKDIYTYYKASRGASTDKPQREERLKILKKIFVDISQ